MFLFILLTKDVLQTSSHLSHNREVVRDIDKKRTFFFAEQVAGCSAVRVARSVRDRKVAGSNPVIPTIFFFLAASLQEIPYLYVSIL